MRSGIFAGILKVVGTPVFLVKWILKAIWFFTYGFVGLLYKISFIGGIKSGKTAYTIVSTTILICVILIICFIKK